MCEQCNNLNSMIRKAEAAGDVKKAKSLTAVLLTHKADMHPRHNVVAVAQDHIVWPDGQRWEVRT